MNDGMAILLADDAVEEAFNIANRIHLSNQWRNPNWVSGHKFNCLRFGLAESLTS